MTTENIKAEIEELKEKLNALEKRVEDDDESKVWRPTSDETYYYVGSTGRIDITTFNSTMDYNICAIGNCYPTREAAEKHVRYLKALTKLKGLTKGFVPDWSQEKQLKHSIYFAHDGKIHGVDGVRTHQSQSSVYFSTVEDAQAAITEMGDQLNDLFEV